MYHGIFQADTVGAIYFVNADVQSHVVHGGGILFFQVCQHPHTLAGHADEGMWMLTDLKEQNAATMYDMGLDISIDKVYCPDSISLKDAVVHFGGGCTGEIISAEGLVLTNHHCGYSYIQQHSSVEHDYLTDGFWAMSRKEELPCKGLTVTFIDRILDVTPYVKEQLAKDEDPEGLNYLSPSYPVSYTHLTLPTT